MENLKDDSNYKYNKDESKYLVKTELEKIPYEKETKDYIVQTITNQNRHLVSEALKLGLKLRAIDYQHNNKTNVRTEKETKVQVKTTKGGKSLKQLRQNAYIINQQTYAIR